jgi:hypothetical protein
MAFPQATAPTRAVLFESDQQTNAVYMFDPDHLQAPALGMITDGISQPGSLAVDAHGVLYVANRLNNRSWVSVYQPGSVHPQKQMQFNFTPESIAVSADETLAIAGSQGFFKDGTVLIFDKGSPMPTRRITLPIGRDIAMETMGIVFDASDDLFVSVGVYPHDARIVEVVPGSTHGIVVKPAPGNGEGVDSGGRFFIGNPNIIVGLSRDLGKQIRTITNGLAGVTALAVTADGHIFASNIFGNQGFIVEYGAGPNPIQMRQGPDTIYPTGVALLPAH